MLSVAHLLGAENLRLEYPTGVVFESITLGLADGDRVGVVGRNGQGKSTLLDLLAKRLAPDAGQVTWRSDLRVGGLSQGDAFPDELSVGRAVVGERAEYEWASDPRIRGIVEALVGDLDLSRPVGQLSGGQRRRVDLAALLTGEWDVLLLDEPTNHLDVAAIDWLARHLKSRWPSQRGALMVVTHDRWFLDEVATTTWEVHDRVVEPFVGGYAAYVLSRVERDRQLAVVEAKRQNLLRKELAWLRRGPPARSSKPQFRIDAANALIADVPPARDGTSLVQLATARLGKTVVDLVGVSAGYGSTTVLRDVTWRIAPGERSGLLGANGAGKSTLLGLVAGSLGLTAAAATRPGRHEAMAGPLGDHEAAPGPAGDHALAPGDHEAEAGPAGDHGPAPDGPPAAFWAQGRVKRGKTVRVGYLGQRAGLGPDSEIGAPGPVGGAGAAAGAWLDGDGPVGTAPPATGFPPGSAALASRSAPATIARAPGGAATIPGVSLADVAADRVREVLGRLKTVFVVGRKEVSPAQLLERLGFDRAQLQTPVRDLSGGEARRLQLLLVLCQEPNVLILDEPTNDVDTEMLTALEDFLDGWPGTLIVVSHDRYLVERVTDQQHALVDGRLRHLPGGVDEFLRLAAEGVATTGPASAGPAGSDAPGAPRVSTAQAERAQRKQLAALERKIAQAEADLRAIHEALAGHNPADYEGLADLLAQAERAQAARDGWETAWLEAAE